LIDMEGILAITFIFGGGSLFLLAISPIGRAIANRIQSGSPDGQLPRDVLDQLEAHQQAVMDEVDALRHDVVEMQERLDFAERLLAQQRQGALPASPGPEDRELGGSAGVRGE